MADQKRTEGGLAPETQGVFHLVDQIRPLLGGQPPVVVGAVLADLLALYLAGHVADTPANTKAVRDATLKIHLRAVKALVPLNEDMLRERMERAQDEAKARPN